MSRGALTRERPDCPRPYTRTHRTTGARAEGCICSLHERAQLEAPVAAPGATYDLADVDAVVVARLITRAMKFRGRGVTDADRYSAVRLLLDEGAEYPVAHAARTLGISERTVERWQKCSGVGEPTDVDATLLRLLARERATSALRSHVLRGRFATPPAGAGWNRDAGLARRAKLQADYSRGGRVLGAWVA